MTDNENLKRDAGVPGIQWRNSDDAAAPAHAYWRASISTSDLEEAPSDGRSFMEKMMTRPNKPEEDKETTATKAEPKYNSLLFQEADETGVLENQESTNTSATVTTSITDHTLKPTVSNAYDWSNFTSHGTEEFLKKNGVTVSEAPLVTNGCKAVEVKSIDPKESFNETLKVITDLLDEFEDSRDIPDKFKCVLLSSVAEHASFILKERYGITL